jgi:hypothetical protein
MESRVKKLRAAGVDAVITIVPNVGHGFGLGIGTDAEGWVDKASSFGKIIPTDEAVYRALRGLINEAVHSR